MPVAMSIRKKFALFIILAPLFYFLLSYHIIIIGRDIKDIRLLKKSTYTLKYTIFSVKSKSNKAILAIDALRENGIVELLIEEGLMTEEEKTLILESLKIEQG